MSETEGQRFFLGVCNSAQSGGHSGQCDFIRKKSRFVKSAILYR